MCRMDAHSHTHRKCRYTQNIFTFGDIHWLYRQHLMCYLCEQFCIFMEMKAQSAHVCMLRNERRKIPIRYSACWLQLGQTFQWIRRKIQIFKKTDSFLSGLQRSHWINGNECGNIRRRHVYFDHTIKSIRNETNDFLHHHHFTIRSHVRSVWSLIVSNIHRRIGVELYGIALTHTYRVEYSWIDSEWENSHYETERLQHWVSDNDTSEITNKMCVDERERKSNKHVLEVLREIKRDKE